MSRSIVGRPGQLRVWRSSFGLAATAGLLSLLTLIAGCDGNSYRGTTPDPDPPGPPPGSTEVGTGGGTARSEDGLASIEIPANALARSTVISVVPAANPPAGNIGSAYTIGPAGTTFATSATVRIAFDSTNFPIGVRTIDLVLAKAIGGAWTPVQDSGPDTATDEVAGPSSDVGMFGIVPLVPAALMAVPADRQVTLSWDPVPDATSYNVYWATQSFPLDGSYPDAVVSKVDSLQSPFLHESLTNGATYSYRVSAQKNSDEGGLSAEASASPIGPTAVPAAPTGLMACAGDQRVSLAWNAATDASMYDVVWNESGSPTSTISGLTQTSYEQVGLTNGVTYEYAVRGVNSVGPGPLSVTVTSATTTLDPPLTLTAVAGIGQVTLSWSGVPCATGYRIHWNTTGNVTAGDPAIDFAVVPNQPLTVSHTGLTGGTTYFYAVAAVNELGEGALSSPEQSATAAESLVAVKVATGQTSGVPSSCAIMADSTLKCWGANPGDGSSSTALPVVVPDISNPMDVSIGNSGHACVVDDGFVKCWGSNGLGQLGDGSTTSTLSPVLAGGIAGATTVSARGSASCAIDSGAVKCWGSSAALGNVDLATGDFGPNSSTPVTIPALPSPAMNVSVSGGGNTFVCAVLANSETWCWGTFGHLFPVDPSQCAFARCRPVQISPPPNNTGIATFVSSGLAHSCFIMDASLGGGVECSGAAKGDTFSTLSTFFAFNVLAAGAEFNCGVAGGNVICWGWNGERQLGDGTNTIYPFTSHVVVDGISAATDVSAAVQHACAIDDGAVKCWGLYPGGPLPVIVPGL